MFRLRSLAVAVTVILLAGLVMVPPAVASPAVRYTNSLVPQRADPHVVKHTDGFYYLAATAPEYDRIVLRRATMLQGLSSATESVIWRRHTSGEMGAHIWAPELHRIDLQPV